MRTRGTVAAAVASAGILLAGWQAGTQAGGTSVIAGGTTAAASGTGGGSSGASASTGASGASSGTGPTSGASPSSGASSTGGAPSTGSSSASGTTSGGTQTQTAGIYAGTAVQTRFGSVQVQITVSGGSITEVTALHLTDDDRKSVQISNRAAPVLRSEVLAAQSANVQTVSGATVTSGAYLTSLQAAIDAANL